MNPYSTTCTKTRTVKFSYGTVKGADLLVPAEPTSLYAVSKLIHQSYLNWAFSGESLVSDDCLLSSIGQANFFAGALGGWKTRLDADGFKALEGLCGGTSLALDIVRYRNPTISTAEAYRVAARNEALSDDERKCLMTLAKHHESAAA